MGFKKTFLLIGSIIFSVWVLQAQEVCNNGLDDDGDGLIDLNDLVDCSCSAVYETLDVTESFFTNPSFEEMNCCPYFLSNLDCLNDWIQPNYGTTDYYNECGFMSPWLQPIPDGNACVGGFFTATYQEIIGICLGEHLIADSTYVIQMSVISAFVNDGDNDSITFMAENNLSNIELTIYGSPNCEDLPYESSLCPMASEGDWEIIGVVEYDPSSTWSEVEIHLISSIDINAIVIGAPCELPAGYPNSTASTPPFPPYFAFDNITMNYEMQLNASITVNTYIEEQDIWVVDGVYIDELSGDAIEVGMTCFDTIELNATINPITDGAYQWYFEGVALIGETESNISVDFEDFIFGNYQFKFVPNDGGDCVIGTLDINPPEIPVAQFDIIIDSNCVPSNVLLQNESIFTEEYTLTWSVNGSVSGQNQDELDTAFVASGVYEFQLDVISSNFCESSLIQSLEIMDLPFVGFDFENNCLNESVSFTNQSDVVDGVIYTWEFGDGFVSSEENPNHTYNFYELYEVSLYAEFENGCSNIQSQFLTPYPIPNLEIYSETVCSPEEAVNFTNQSTISDGLIEQWVWEFGDSNTSNEFEPQHFYDEPGIYEIVLTGISEYGCVNTVNSEQIVSEMSTLISHNYIPECSPACGTSIAEINNAVGEIDQINWEFDNGETENGSSIQKCFVNHSYSEILTMGGSLTAINSYGCEQITYFEDFVEIWPNPKADFYMDQYAVFISDLVSFNNESVNGMDYEWNFSNGNFSNEHSPIIFFDDPGSSWVELVVISDFGCKDSLTRNFTIFSDFLFVPNAFTPDGDGLNDLFRPEIFEVDVSEYLFTIYDRWGQVVFLSEEKDLFWNGSSINNKDYFVADGIYIWTIRIKTAESDVIDKNGTVLITR